MKEEEEKGGVGRGGGEKKFLVGILVENSTKVY